MNTKILYAFLGGTALIIVGLLVYNQSHQSIKETEPQKNVSNNVGSDIINVPSPSTIAVTPQPTEVQSINPESDAGHFSDESDIQQGSIVEIVYNGTTYEPGAVTITAGDTVVFKNKSKNNFWPVSEPSPLHTDYPSFGAKQAIAPEGIFEFKFLKPGEWTYRDRVHPSATGKITAR